MGTASTPEATAETRGHGEEEDEAEAAGMGDVTAETPQRPKRARAAAANYVHTRQYRKRGKKEGYMLRNGQAHTLHKRAMEVGPATVERATKGRYDWQDGGLRKRRREDETREVGERRLRPRDPGKEGRHA